MSGYYEEGDDYLSSLLRSRENVRVFQAYDCMILHREEAYSQEAEKQSWIEELRIRYYTDRITLKRGYSSPSQPIESLSAFL